MKRLQLPNCRSSAAISDTALMSFTLGLSTTSSLTLLMGLGLNSNSSISDMTTASHMTLIARNYNTPLGGYTDEDFIGYRIPIGKKTGKEISGASIERDHQADIVGSAPDRLSNGRKRGIRGKKCQILGDGALTRSGGVSKVSRSIGSSVSRKPSIHDNKSNKIDEDGYDEDLNKILGPFTQFIKTKKLSSDVHSINNFFDEQISPTTESDSYFTSATDNPPLCSESNTDSTIPNPKELNHNEMTKNIEADSEPLSNYPADLRLFQRNNDKMHRTMRDKCHRRIDENNCSDQDVIKEYRPFQYKKRLEELKESGGLDCNNEVEAGLPHHLHEGEIEKIRKRTQGRGYRNQPNISAELSAMSRMEPEEKEERFSERWKLHKTEKKWTHNALSDDIEAHQSEKRTQLMSMGVSEINSSTTELITPEEKSKKEPITMSFREIDQTDLYKRMIYDTTGDAKQTGSCMIRTTVDNSDNKRNSMFYTQGAILRAEQELVPPSAHSAVHDMVEAHVDHVQFYIGKGPQLLADERISRLEADIRNTMMENEKVHTVSLLGDGDNRASDNSAGLLDGERYSDIYEPYIPVDDTHRHRPFEESNSASIASVVDHEQVPYTPSSELLSHAEIAKIMNASVLNYFTNVVHTNSETDARQAAGEELIQEERALERSQMGGVVSPQTTVFSSELVEYEGQFLGQLREDRYNNMYKVPSGVIPAPEPSWISSKIPSSSTADENVQHEGLTGDASAISVKEDIPTSTVVRNVHANMSPTLYRPSDYIPLDDNLSIFDGVLCGKDTFEEVETGVGPNGRPIIVRRRVLRTGLRPTGRDGVLGYSSHQSASYSRKSSVSSAIMSERRKLMNRAACVDEECEMQNKERLAGVSYIKIDDYFADEGNSTQEINDDQPASNNPHFPTKEEEEVRERNKRNECYKRLMSSKPNIDGASDSEKQFETDDNTIDGSADSMSVTGSEWVTDDEAYELAMDFFSNAARRRNEGYEDGGLVLSTSPSDQTFIDLDKEKKRAPHLNLSTHGSISTVLQKDPDSMLHLFHRMRGRISSYTSDLARESVNTILVRHKAEMWWDNKLSGKLRDEITEYNQALEETREDYLLHTDGMVDATVAHHNTSSNVRHYEMKYDNLFPRNERIQEEYVTISRVVPTDGGKLTVIPPENRVRIRTGEARRISKGLGLDLIRIRSGGMGDRREAHAVCQIADHRYDKRDFVAYHIRQQGFNAVKTREPREMTFRGTTHPHAIWFKSVGVAKIIYHRHPVIIEMDNFGSIREGMAAFQSVLDEIKKQCTKLNAFHTCGPVKAEYDRISCILYPSTPKNPKTSIIHPTLDELRTVRDHRIIEQDRDMYHEDLLEANRTGGGKNLVRYMRALNNGTAWSWKDEGLSLKRKRDIKRIYGWLPKGNDFYEGRGDVELEGPQFRTKNPQGIENVSYPRVSNLEQAERGFAVIQDRYNLPISEMHDNNETEENESIISRFYSRMSGDAMEIGSFKTAFGLKTNRRKLPQLPSGASWATLGVDDNKQ